MDIERTTLEPGLEVLVYSYDLTTADFPGPAWIMVTKGLSAFGQREVVLTILRNTPTPRHFPHTVLDYVRALKQFVLPGKVVSDGDVSSYPRHFPHTVLDYVRVLKQFALQGKVVSDGDVSGYRAPGPFRLGAFVGLGFFDAPPIAGVDLPDKALAGVFLTEGELSMATSCSLRRVFNRLGLAARYFPVPYWSDPARSSFYHPQDVTRSLLAKFPRANVPDASATLRGDVMHLSLPSAFAITLAERIEHKEPGAILPGRPPGVTAALVWSPEQPEPLAIFQAGSDPSAIAATFVAFVPNDAEQDHVRFTEDGYAVLLSASSARHLVTALRSGSPSEVTSASDRRTLVITITPVQ